MSEYKITDLRLQMEGNKLVGVSLVNEDHECEICGELSKSELRDMLIAAIIAKPRTVKLFSDYFNDEESTRFFLVVLEGRGWTVLADVQDIYEALQYFDTNGPFYHINIDDSNV